MIPKQEIADILKQIARREIIPEEKIEWTYCGHIGIKAKGFEIVIFIDCDEIDYIDRAIDKDGNETEFEEWHDDDEKDPIDLLTEQEISILEEIFKGEELPQKIHHEYEIVSSDKRTVVDMIDFEYVYIPLENIEADKLGYGSIINPCLRFMINKA